MNEHLKVRLKGIQEILMAHHRATVLLSNPAKGAEREVLVRDFLERVFPAPYRFGSGTVIDSKGRRSGQLDIVVEWPFFASFPGPLGNQRLYLADSVAFVIEVKSDLISEWDDLMSEISQLRVLERRWAGHTPIGKKFSADVDYTSGSPATVSGIPSIAVGPSGHKTLDGLQKRLQSTPTNACPDAALVIESGAFSGWGHDAIGEEGLFAFCIVGSEFARNVLVAEPDLTPYLQ